MLIGLSGWRTPSSGAMAPAAVLVEEAQCSLLGRQAIGRAVSPVQALCPVPDAVPNEDSVVLGAPQGMTDNA